MSGFFIPSPPGWCERSEHDTRDMIPKMISALIRAIFMEKN